LKCSDIKALADGTRVDAYLQCKSKSYKSIATGRGEIIAGELGDNTGNIKYVIFSGATINCKELDTLIKIGEVVNVNGIKNTHEGAHQIVVSSRDGSSMRVADPEEYDLADFVSQSNQDNGTMWSYITGLLNSITDPFLKSLVSSFTNDVDFVRKFRVYYGARMHHHACVGGLLEHTWEVLQYCELSCKLHPSLERDLVYAGAFLHDIGIVRENSEPLGLSESKEGFMMGHIYLSAETVSNRIYAIPEFPEITRMKLINIILSHQEKREQDTAEPPRTPEAITVACAESFGSKVTQYIRAKKDSPGGTWKTQSGPIGWIYIE
jgi:3'-5' exoribonuclease